VVLVSDPGSARNTDLFLSGGWLGSADRQQRVKFSAAKGASGTNGYRIQVPRDVVFNNAPCSPLLARPETPGVGEAGDALPCVFPTGFLEVSYMPVELEARPLDSDPAPTFAQMILTVRNLTTRPIPLSSVRLDYFFGGTASNAVDPSGYRVYCMDYQALPLVVDAPPADRCAGAFRTRILATEGTAEVDASLTPGARYTLRGDFGRQIGLPGGYDDVLLLPQDAVRAVENDPGVVSSVQRYRQDPTEARAAAMVDAGCGAAGLQGEACGPWAVSAQVILSLESVDMEPLSTLGDFSFLDTPPVTNPQRAEYWTSQGIVPRQRVANPRLPAYLSAPAGRDAGGAERLAWGETPGHRRCASAVVPPGFVCPGVPEPSEDQKPDCFVRVDFCCEAPEGEDLSTVLPSAFKSDYGAPASPAPSQDPSHAPTPRPGVAGTPVAPAGAPGSGFPVNAVVGSAVGVVAAVLGAGALVLLRLRRRRRHLAGSDSEESRSPVSGGVSGRYLPSGTGRHLHSRGAQCRGREVEGQPDPSFAAPQSAKGRGASPRALTGPGPAQSAFGSSIDSRKALPGPAASQGEPSGARDGFDTGGSGFLETGGGLGAPGFFLRPSVDSLPGGSGGLGQGTHSTVGELPSLPRPRPRLTVVPEDRGDCGEPASEGVDSTSDTPSTRPSPAKPPPQGPWHSRPGRSPSLSPSPTAHPARVVSLAASPSGANVPLSSAGLSTHRRASSSLAGSATPHAATPGGAGSSVASTATGLPLGDADLVLRAPGVSTRSLMLSRHGDGGPFAPPSPPAFPLIPFDSLTMVSLLGRGAFGEVWRARWARPGPGRAAGEAPGAVDVAVKIICPGTPGASPSPERSEELARSIRQELVLLAGLRHPRIVACHGGDLRPAPFLVLELLPRGSLDAIIHPAGGERVRLSYDSTLALCVDVSQALAYLHPSGIIHRDLKPQNILIAGDGAAKLADFGIAKIRDPDGTLTKFLLSRNDGTPFYMAPEVLQSRVITEKCDIYSLGLVLIESFSGVRPWAELTDPFQVVFKVCVEKARPPIPDDTPRPFRRLLEKMVHDSPLVRPSAADVVIEATRLLREASGGPAAPSREPTPPGPTPRPTEVLGSRPPSAWGSPAGTPPGAGAGTSGGVEQ